MELFKEEAASNSHPAHCIMDLLAAKVVEHNALHATQLTTWFRDYTAMRGNPGLFKSDVDTSLLISMVLFFRKGMNASKGYISIYQLWVSKDKYLTGLKLRGPLFLK